jgi:uncharacterized membrane protein YraQ (UPF0718 family)
VLWACDPVKGMSALKSSIAMLKTVIGPLLLVFAIMTLMNKFVSSEKVAGLVGRGAGYKGPLLSLVGGIISMGPIMAWFPLLKRTKQKGGSQANLAIFLGARAVKPILLPVMVSYFGWIFSLLIVAMTLLGSLLTGWCVGVIADYGKGRNV